MKALNLLSLKKILARLKRKIIFCINVFCYENNLIYHVHVSDEKFENCINLLIITDKNKSHYIYIKDFDKFMCNTTRCKNKKYFCRFCIQCFASAKVSIEHRAACLKINGKQTVKLRSGLIKFKNHFKKLAVPFKIYADLECNMERVRVSDRNDTTPYTEK